MYSESRKGQIEAARPPHLMRQHNIRFCLTLTQPLASFRIVSATASPTSPQCVLCVRVGRRSHLARVVRERQNESSAALTRPVMIYVNFELLFYLSYVTLLFASGCPKNGEMGHTGLLRLALRFATSRKIVRSGLILPFDHLIRIRT